MELHVKQLGEFGISSEDSTLLLSALYDGAVNLLTGAGASYGALGGDGEELKGGADLARELNTRFSLQNEEPDCANLQLVYGDIASIPSNKSKLASFLVRRFTKCRVTWQSQLFLLPWKHIWTLNIDDILQQAVPSNFKRVVDFYSWQDKLRVRTLDGDDLQIIHLHGRADRVDSNLNGIIFSLQEYASRHEISPGWHAEFRNEFVKKPFIICGSRLRDEFDLATVLAFGNHSRERGGCPSFIVLRDFSPGEEERFKRQGLVPVRASGADFISSLQAAYSKYESIVSNSRSTTREAEIEVHSKFRRLDTVNSSPQRQLDYYSGVEAQWYHIIADQDAQFPDVQDHAKWLGDKTRDVRVSMVVGGPVSGKTTFALRLARQLAVDGYHVWDFRGEDYFEPKLVLEYLETVPLIVLVFDDCADFSGALSELLTAAVSGGQSLRVIATASKHRRRGVQRDLSAGQLRTVQLEPLARKAFEAVFAKRGEKGRLGRCTGSNAADAWREFKDHYSMKFLEWLESLEGALPYQLALSRILDDSASEGSRSRQLMLATAAAHRFGFSLPFDFVGRIGGEGIFSDFDGPAGDFADIAYFDDKGLRLRSKAFSVRIWRQATSHEKYEIALFLAKHLSPLVVPQTIARRSYSYRLLREIMDCDVVRNELGDRANEWYEELLPLLGWNSRYWEQRALLSLKNKEDDRAYSYAKEAVQRQSGDAFPHTTLGTVCLNIATRRADETGLDRLWEGVQSLEVSRKLAVERGTEWEHPYMTFFTYALRAYVQYPLAAERLSSEWTHWMRLAQNSSLFNFDNEGQATLSTFQAEWLKLAVSR